MTAILADASRRRKRILQERAALALVALRAEHLEIVRQRLAALAPRDDVVALHFGEFEVLAADRAEPALLRVGGLLLRVGERPQVQKLPFFGRFARFASVVQEPA